MDDFEHSVEVQVRYRDLDPMNHVNNAVYGMFFEEARVAYFDDVLGEPLNERDMVIANIDVQFERPVMEAGETVEIRSRVPSIGSSSFPIEYEVWGSDERKAYGETTLVCYDRESNSSRPVPEEWREKITTFEGL